MVEGRRQRGRSKLRCEDGVMEDARKMGERNWRNAARNRDSWQKLLKKSISITQTYIITIYLFYSTATCFD